VQKRGCKTIWTYGWRYSKINHRTAEPKRIVDITKKLHIWPPLGHRMKPSACLMQARQGRKNDDKDVEAQGRGNGSVAQRRGRRDDAKTMRHPVEKKKGRRTRRGRTSEENKRISWPVEGGKGAGGQSARLPYKEVILQSNKASS